VLLGAQDPNSLALWKEDRGQGRLSLGRPARGDVIGVMASRGVARQVGFLRIEIVAILGVVSVVA
jgi:hypothetical protein